MKNRSDADGLPCREFVSPLPLLALAALAINDHLLKPRGWPVAWLTGKLSDLAGLFLFPLLLCALLRTAHQLLRRPVTALPVAGPLLVCSLVTGTLFATIKCVPAAARLAAAWLEALLPLARFAFTPDPSDCLALLALPLAYAYGLRAGRQQQPRRPSLEVA